MSKGSGRRPSFIPKDEWDRRYAETFAEQERRLANDPAERGRRLTAASSRKLRSTLPPDRTITNNVSE